MKIVCTKEEYAALLRKCFMTETFDSCKGCLLEGFFKPCPGLESAVEAEIAGTKTGGDPNG
jgi:hypothetical protein